MPRTGSSHVNKLINCSPNFVGKGELFHRQWNGRQRPFEIAALKAASGGVVVDENSFRGWRGAHPLQTLEALHGVWKTKTIAFKIFPGHLPRELMESELLPRGDFACAILKRRPIESFVSSVKAGEIGRYGLTDTTEMKPEISPENFLRWARRMRKWYKWVRQVFEARARPFAEISFEQHLDGCSAQESLAHLRDLFIPLGISNFDGFKKRAEEGTRQDRERDYRKRVANWDAFEAALRDKPQASKMLKWAQRIP
jgi:hypothetical protein